MPLWPDFPTPIVFAHRGASAHAPENTLAAFALAAQQGAEAIELDAKLSADGHVVVIHDATVDRTTDGHGSVAALPLAALRKLEAGSFFSEKFRGEHIPTLDEVFETVGKRLFINIELTNYVTPSDGLVEKVGEAVNRHNMGERVLLSSFFPGNLSKAAHLLPEVPRGLLAWRGWLGVWGRSFGFAFGAYRALHPHIADTSPQQVQRVHRLRRCIHVWTANDETSIRRLHGWGVDGVFTDNPQLAVRVLGRRK